MRQLALIIAIAFAATAQATIPWPFEPFDSAQPIGNSYGEYQDYGGQPYLHPGIDILHPPGTPVYAVKSGWVKAVLTTAASLHWRVAIADCNTADSCDGWLYAHLEETSIPISVGEWVDSGQFIGTIVQWPVADFHHLHFVKIRSAGISWSANWLFVGNPLDELVNIDDFTPPYFLNISVGAKFRFCRDNSDNFFEVGQPLDGDVDIIAKAHDRIGHPTWVVTPHAMGYEIYSDSVMIGPCTSFVFTGLLLWNEVQHVIFKNSGPCNSAGDYNQRQFYEILTNHDSDPLITRADTTGKWATGLVPNDTYTIKAWAADRYGNIAVDSMSVSTANFYTISGKVRTSDGNPQAAGYIAAIEFTGVVDTLADSSFVLLSQPAGRYDLAVSRLGYLTETWTCEVFDDLSLEFVLPPAPYIDGDVDFSGAVTVSDAVYLINYIFMGGPVPVPYASAMNIDNNPIVSVSDAVYLITYIFGEGPPPGGGR